MMMATTRFVFTVLGGSLLFPCFADQPGKKPISRDGFFKAVEIGGLSNDELITYIVDLGVGFQLNDQDRTKLNQNGVDARVLTAVTEHFRAEKPQIDERAVKIAQLSQGGPLSKDQVVQLLRQGNTSDVIEHVVERRGVSFAMTPAEGKEIEAAGGNRGLLGVLFLKQPVAAPVQAATPKPPAVQTPPPPVATPPKPQTSPAANGTPVNQAVAALTSKAVTPARLIKQGRLDYPMAARRDRISGAVNIEIVINDQGKVEKAKALGGHPLLIMAALTAVKQWEYEPARIDGKPAPVTTEVQVVFKMNP